MAPPEYTDKMKRISSRGEKALIKCADRRTEAVETTLDKSMAEGLGYAAQYRISQGDVQRAAATVGHFRAGHRLTRDERNER